MNFELVMQPVETFELVMQPVETNEKIIQFNNGVLQLINMDKIYEEIVIIINKNYNIIIIDLDYNDIDLAQPYGLNVNNGLYYMVLAETFPLTKYPFKPIKIYQLWRIFNKY
jgi:hypothetical protein